MTDTLMQTVKLAAQFTLLVLSRASHPASLVDWFTRLESFYRETYPACRWLAELFLKQPTLLMTSLVLAPRDEYRDSVSKWLVLVLRLLSLSDRPYGLNIQNLTTTSSAPNGGAGSGNASDQQSLLTSQFISLLLTQTKTLTLVRNCEQLFRVLLRFATFGPFERALLLHLDALPTLVSFYQGGGRGGSSGIASSLTAPHYLKTSLEVVITLVRSTNSGSYALLPSTQLSGPVLRLSDRDSQVLNEPFFSKVLNDDLLRDDVRAMCAHLAWGQRQISHQLLAWILNVSLTSPRQGSLVQIVCAILQLEDSLVLWRAEAFCNMSLQLIESYHADRLKKRLCPTIVQFMLAVARSVPQVSLWLYQHSAKANAVLRLCGFHIVLPT